VLRILRIVKTMRPLRLILFRIERVRIVIHAMRDSIGPLQVLLQSVTIRYHRDVRLDRAAAGLWRAAPEQEQS
jgi:hypothetical protein